MFDGLNLVITTIDGKKIAHVVKLKAIKKYGKWLKREIPEVVPILFVDSSIFHYIDDKKWLKAQLNSWKIFKSDNGHEVDEFFGNRIR